MEVSEIQRVVFDLAGVCRLICCCTNLELDNDDSLAAKQNDI
jgi:hypothetical protein